MFDSYLPSCTQHFQGDGVKHLMRIVTRFLLRNDSSVRNHPVLAKPANSVLLIRTFGAADVYNVTNNREKKKLTLEEFNAHNYNWNMVLNVPPEIDALFSKVNG